MAHREKEMKDKTLPARRKQEEEHEKAAGAEGGAEELLYIARIRFRYLFVIYSNKFYETTFCTPPPLLPCPHHQRQYMDCCQANTHPQEEYNHGTSCIHRRN